MIQVYAHFTNRRAGVITFFMYDPTTNLRTAYIGNTTDLIREPFVNPMYTKTDVYDPDDTYFLLDIETVHRLPNKEKLLSIFKNLHPELFI